MHGLSIEQQQLIWFVRSYNLGFAADNDSCRVEAQTGRPGAFRCHAGSGAHITASGNSSRELERPRVRYVETER